MKTAIIGLPMTGKTSLFTILTGVHQETRIGSTSARTGIARVPDTMPHEKGSVDPIRDMEDLETELILNDFAVLEKRLERLEKDRKKIKNPELDREYDLLVKCKAMIEDNKPLRELVLDAEDEKRIRGFQFLSQKPMLYVLNIGEEEAGRLHEREEEYRDGPLAGRAH